MSAVRGGRGRPLAGRAGRWLWMLLLPLAIAGPALVVRGLAASPGPSASTSPAAGWLESALEDLARGRLESAVGKLRLARWDAPGDPEVTVLLAWVYGARGDWQQAADLLTGLAPDSLPPSARAAALGLLAAAQEALGRLPEAARVWGAVLQAFPDAVLARRGLGELALSAARDPRQAAALARAWPDRPVPTSPSGWRAAGEAYLRAAIQRAPDRVDLYVSLVESLMESSRWQEAESLVREALRVDFRVPELHYDLGRILEQRGDRQAAAAAYRRALEVDPAFLPARLRLESLQPSTPGR